MSERRIGILIASSRFPEEPRLEDLRFPENDVDGLNEILTSQDHGQFTQTFLLKNKLHHEILLKINQVLREADKNDLVLIYYSGHGKLNPAGKLHLASTDSVINALEATSIPVSTIRDYVDVSSSNRIVLILDCCFSGAAGEAFARGGVDDQLHLVSGGRGTYILTASTGIQVAQEKESDQYGVFTKHLIEGIKSGDADFDSNGRITMGDLYRYVHDKVLDEGFQEPMKWDLNVRGEMVIARSGKTPLAERRKKILKMLYNLAADGILPEDILDKARLVIALEPDQLSEEDRTYDKLLDQLLKKRLVPVEFIRKWDKVKSGKPGPPPKRQKDLKRKAEEERKRKAEEERKRKAEEERKRKNQLKFGVVFGVIVLLITGVLLYYNSQPKKEINTKSKQVQKQETLSKIEEFHKQVEDLENAVAKLDKPEQLEELYRQRDTLSHQVKGLSEQATRVGLESQLEQLQERLKQVQNQIANKATEFKEKEYIKVRQTMDKLDRQALDLENAVKELDKPEQLEELYRQRDALSHQVKGLSEQAIKIGMLSRLEQLQNRLERIQIQLANKEKELIAARKGPISPQKSITNSIGMKFVLIQAGSFTMGSQLSPEEVVRKYGGEAGLYKGEHPPHPVEITKPFYLQATEVSQGQWKRVMGNNPSKFKDCGDDCPVELVFWNDTQIFITKLNQKEGTNKYRLPTEAEWEYACRAGTTTVFSFGNEIDKLGEYAWYSDNSKGKTKPVGSRKPNAWGLYDMHGNVYEWCQDRLGRYPSNSVVDPKGPEKGEGRVLRGGSWNYVAGGLRSAFRLLRGGPGFRGSGIGFRVARDF